MNNYTKLKEARKEFPIGSRYISKITSSASIEIIGHSIGHSIAGTKIAIIHFEDKSGAKYSQPIEIFRSWFTNE